MLMHFIGFSDVDVESQQAVVVVLFAGICKKAALIQSSTATVVVLNVERSGAEMPHDLGIHRKLITVDGIWDTLMCSKRLCLY